MSDDRLLFPALLGQGNYVPFVFMLILVFSFERPQVKKQNQELMTVLHVQLAEAINLEDRSLSAQLHETIRCIKELSAHRYRS